jgi:hypothetical protein
MEEQFFFKYYLKTGRDEFRDYPILERKWMMHRFLMEKEKENQEMEKLKRDAKKKR